jgi:hypothetical protein
MNPQKSRAIDLMIEDLHTYNPEIRTKAKFQGCEKELDDIKYQLVNYLKFLRKTP